MSLLQRVLSPDGGSAQGGESTGILLMFAYSFLAMTAYNIIQPLTRSKLIASLGAVNVPWVIFGRRAVHRRADDRLHAAGQRAAAALGAADHANRHGGHPARLLGPVPDSGGDWVSVALLLSGVCCSGVLLISQFWTLANGVYDAAAGQAAVRFHRRRRRRSAA